MTIGLRVNENNDLYINDFGMLATTQDLDTIIQNCETAVKAQLGEMIFAVDSGMPNQQVTWVGQPKLQQFDAAIRSIIRNVDGVLGVNNTVTNVDGDNLNYRVEISTVFGSNTLNLINLSILNGL